MSFYTPDGYDDLMAAIVAEGGEVPCTTWPDLFFPEVGQSNLAAKKLCQSCPIKLQCLEYALSANETVGVWGGLSPLERRKLKNVS